MSSEEAHPGMPAVSELMRDIAEDGKSAAEPSSLQRLMRVHRNLGQPPNRMTAQLMLEAKAPASAAELASKSQCPLCARHARTSVQKLKVCTTLRSCLLVHQAFLSFLGNVYNT